MNKKDGIKCQFILANDEDEIVEIVEGEDLFLRSNADFERNVTNCEEYEEKKLHIKDIKCNCDIQMNFYADRYDIQDYAWDVGDQIIKLNRLSNLQEVQALTEIGIHNIEDLVATVSMKEYRFLSKDKQEEIYKIFSNKMQDSEKIEKLNKEGVFMTSTGIVLFLSKPNIREAETIVLDDNKVKKNEQAQLKVLIANSENEEEQQWIEFPMQNPKEIRTSIIKKFHIFDEYSVVRTWSNCGLIEDRRFPINDIEEYILQTQEELVEINKIADVLKVKCYTSMLISPTPTKILYFMKERMKR